MSKELRLSVSDEEADAIENHGGLRAIVDAAIAAPAEAERPFRVSRKKAAAPADEEEDDASEAGDEADD